MTKNSNDWADFGFYNDLNLKLIAAPHIVKSVVLMGDSITQGWTLPDGDPDFFKGKPYINRGIGGQTTPQMLLRFRADVIDLRPKAVVILAGTNDIAENTGPTTLKKIMDNIASMAEIAAANEISVLLCSVLPVLDYPWKSGLNPTEKIVDLNTMIRTYADAKKMTFVDYFTAMADSRNGLKNDYSEDGVHPNKKGYEAMGRVLEYAIAKALKNIL